MIFLEILLLALGFALLIKGADWFVDGASGIADKFGIPQLVIGLTVVAILAGVVLWVCTFRTKKLTRTGGIIMLICYVAYFVYLLIK